MSDYFGALMRAAGVVLSDPGAAEPLTAERRGPFDPVLAQQALELPAMEDPRQTPPRPGWLPAASELPPAPPAQAGPTASAEPATTAAEAAESRPPPREPGLPQAAPAPTGREAGEPAPLAQALVQAAIRWVREPQVGTETPSRATEADARAAQPDAAKARGQHALAQSLAADNEAGMTEQSFVHAPRPERVTGPMPSPFAAPILPMASTPAPARRDGPVEVSIGSIHLRVEAPAPQTVVAPPAPVIAPAAAPAPRRRGSALARRALRRI